MTAPSRLRTSAFVATLLVTAASLAACDPPPTKDLLLGPSVPAAFAVETVSPGRGAVPADGAVVVRMSDDVDPKSVGRRSVRVTRPRGRAVAVLARVEGRELRVTPLPGREFPTGERLRLWIEGAPSP